MKTLKTIAIILLALVVGGPLFAQTPPPPPQKMDSPKHERMDSMRGLNLTDQQKEQIKQIRLDMMKAMTPLRNQMKEKRAELHTLTTGDNADFNAAENVVDDIAKLQADMMKQGLQSKKKIRDLLTDEQRVKFDARPSFAERFKKHMKAPGRHHR